MNRMHLLGAAVLAVTLAGPALEFDERAPRLLVVPKRGRRETRQDLERERRNEGKERDRNKRHRRV